MELPKITQKPRPGTEPLHLGGESLGVSVLDFWRWSASDLLSNAPRGRFAEFIVANVLGNPLDEVRDEWGAYDLVSPEGIRVEVKPAAYIQSWYQSKPSIISFRIPKTRSWDADTNLQATEARRQAEVYVFALLAHSDQTTIDPLNVDQWQLFVLPTIVLDSRTRSQHSITLRTLAALSGGEVIYKDLKKKVQTAHEKNNTAI